MNANIDVIMGNVKPAEVLRAYDAVLAVLDAAIAANQREVCLSPRDCADTGKCTRVMFGRPLCSDAGAIGVGS